jgi:hypothetical protein
VFELFHLLLCRGAPPPRPVPRGPRPLGIGFGDFLLSDRSVGTHPRTIARAPRPLGIGFGDFLLSDAGPILEPQLARLARSALASATFRSLDAQ